MSCAHHRSSKSVRKDKTNYYWAIIDYIAGMTDQYAIKMFNSLTSF